METKELPECPPGTESYCSHNIQAITAVTLEEVQRAPIPWWENGDVIKSISADFTLTLIIIFIVWRVSR